MTRHVAALSLSVLMVTGATAAPKSSPVTPIQAPAAANQLTPETGVRLVLLDRLKSGSSKKGDRVSFRVDDDVVDPAGTVLIRRGTLAYGAVSASRGNGMFGRRGILDITVDYTTSVDGQRVPLRATQSKGGHSAGGVAIGLGALVAWPLIFVRGSNTSIDPGTPLTAYVADTVRVGAAAASSDNSVKSNASTSPRKLVVLTNGDKLTGSVEGLANGVYTVVTASGTLHIPAADVREITEAAPAPDAPATAAAVAASPAATTPPSAEPAKSTASPKQPEKGYQDFPLVRH